MLVEMVIDGVEVLKDGSSGDLAADLIIRVADGDQRAFAELYDLLSPRVFALILKVVVNRSQSEEVLQEVFLEVWQRAGTFDESRGKAVSWILVMAHRRAVDRVRASQASKDRDLREGIRDFAASHDDVEKVVEANLEGARVRRALAELADSQRRAIELAYFGGYTHRQVAEILDVPVGTIKTRIRDGMIRLRNQLGVE